MCWKPDESVRGSLLPLACQGCVIAPDFFATGMDRLIETSVGRGMNNITVGQCAFTDLDFADDVSLLAEVLELLVPAVEIFREAATPLGLELAENKCSEPASLCICEHNVQRVDSLVL